MPDLRTVLPIPSNPFAFCIGVAYFVAAFMECQKPQKHLAVAYCCYAVATIALSYSK
jgi:hypothetical protein